jgi:hypothetical protein
MYKGNKATLYVGIAADVLTLLCPAAERLGFKFQAVPVNSALRAAELAS